MSTTHNLEILLDKDALLAQSRLSLKLNEKVNQFDLRIALKDTRRNEGGKVTKTTLNYIQKLIDVVNSKKLSSFVNNQPSKLFFSIRGFVCLSRRFQFKYWNNLGRCLHFIGVFQVVNILLWNVFLKVDISEKTKTTTNTTHMLKII